MRRVPFSESWFFSKLRSISWLFCLETYHWHIITIGTAGTANGGRTNTSSGIFQNHWISQSKKINFIVFTNGRWYNPHTLLQHLKKLQYFDGFLISLHGPNAEIHEAFTQTPGSFYETLENIKLAVEIADLFIKANPFLNSCILKPRFNL